MWFAALSESQPGGWFERFMQRLQEGSPEVLALLSYNPFPERPPNYLRATSYRYTYTQPERRKFTGQVWNREKLRLYWP
jgi:lipase maturation factor 1